MLALGGIADDGNIKTDITGPTGAKVDFKIVDLKNGNYTVVYEPKDIGDHEVSLMLWDMPLVSRKKVYAGLGTRFRLLWWETDAFHLC